MLLGIQKDLDAKRRPSKSGRSCSLSSLALGDIEATKIILKSIDDYCYGKQWMYHIGSEKGCAIARFLRGGVEEWMKKKNRSKKVRSRQEIKSACKLLWLCEAIICFFYTAIVC